MERNWKNYVIPSHMPRDKLRPLLKQDSNSTLFSKEVIGKFDIWCIGTILHIISVSLVMDFCHWWVEIEQKSTFEVNFLCQESLESFWISFSFKNSILWEYTYFEFGINSETPHRPKISGEGTQCDKEADFKSNISLHLRVSYYNNFFYSFLH